MEMQQERRTAAIDPIGEATLEAFAASEGYNRLLWSRLRALAPPAGRVLEIGCGIGNITRLILEDSAVTRVHGVELHPSYVERLLASLGGDRVSATACGLEDFSGDRHDEARPGSFDAAVMSNVLEHIEDDSGALRRIHELLRPGGTLLLLVPAHPWLYSSLDRGLSHFRRYTRRRVDEVARGAGLEVVRMRHFNPLAVLGWWWNGAVLRRSVLPAGQLRAYSRWAVPLSAGLDRLNPLPVGISLIAALRRPR